MSIMGLVPHVIHDVHHGSQVTSDTHTETQSTGGGAMSTGG
jgi:hypothetical protein